MPLPTTDWRTWTVQQEANSGTVFPGQLAITDYEDISNTTQAALTITGVTTANPGVVTVGSTAVLQTGQTVVIAGVAGATQANGTWTATVINATTLSIPVNVTGTYSGSGATLTPYEIYTTEAAFAAVGLPTWDASPNLRIPTDPFAGWSSQQEFGPAIAITGVTTANPGVVTVAAHPYVVGETVLVAGVVGATQANGVWVISAKGATTFTIPVNVTGTYSSGGTVRSLLGRPSITGLT